MTAETEAQWHQLAKAALEYGKLAIAERCYAAVGNIAKAYYLHQVSCTSNAPCHACVLSVLHGCLDFLFTAASHVRGWCTSEQADYNTNMRVGNSAVSCVLQA